MAGMKVPLLSWKYFWVDILGDECDQDHDCREIEARDQNYWIEELSARNTPRGVATPHKISHPRCQKGRRVYTYVMERAKLMITLAGGAQALLCAVAGGR
jgi:hypothetical protein